MQIHRLKHTFLNSRFRAFAKSGAWIMILIGLVLFSLRTPLTATAWVNLPLVVTIIQTLGLIFTMAGLLIFISIMIWPDVKFSELLEQANSGNTAAGLVIAGLFVFNGLALIGIILWLNSAFGAALGQ